MTSMPYLNLPITRPRRVLPLDISTDPGGYDEYPLPVRSASVSENPSEPLPIYPSPIRAGELNQTAHQDDMPMPVRSEELPPAFDDHLPQWPTARAAQGEADERALVDKGQQYRAYEKVRDTRPEARKGVWGHVLGGLKGLAYGGLGGAVVGAVSPQTIRDYEWRSRDVPEALQRAEIERGEQKRQLDAGLDIARSTGVNPWTQQPTEMARSRALNEGLRTDAQVETRRQHQIVNDQSARTERERIAATAVQRAATMRQKVPMAAVRGTSLEAYGDMVPPKDEKLPHFEGEGRMIWDPVQRKLVPTPGAEGLPPRRDLNELTPGEKLAEQNRMKTEARQRLGDARRDLQEFRKLQASAKEANDLATAVHNALSSGKAKAAGGVLIKGKTYTPDDEPLLWDERDKAARAMKEHARSMGETHQGLVNVNDAGDYAEINKDAERELTAPRQSASRSGSQPAPHDVALQLYKTYVQQHPDKKEAARQKFIKQRGVDPEAQ